MAKIRVHELAKKLNMTNKALLTKLEAMNIEVKSHMSSLEDETVNEIKLNLSGNKQKEQTARISTSVIRRRKKNKNSQTASYSEKQKNEKNITENSSKNALTKNDINEIDIDSSSNRGKVRSEKLISDSELPQKNYDNENIADNDREELLSDDTDKSTNEINEAEERPLKLDHIDRATQISADKDIEINESDENREGINSDADAFKQSEKITADIDNNTQADLPSDINTKYDKSNKNSDNGSNEYDDKSDISYAAADKFDIPHALKETKTSERTAYINKKTEENIKEADMPKDSENQEKIKQERSKQKQYRKSNDAKSNKKESNILKNTEDSLTISNRNQEQADLQEQIDSTKSNEMEQMEDSFDNQIKETEDIKDGEQAKEKDFLQDKKKKRKKKQKKSEPAKIIKLAIPPSVIPVQQKNRDVEKNTNNAGTSASYEKNRSVNYKDKPSKDKPSSYSDREKSYSDKEKSYSDREKSYSDRERPAFNKNMPANERDKSFDKFDKRDRIVSSEKERYNSDRDKSEKKSSFSEREKLLNPQKVSSKEELALLKSRTKKDVDFNIPFIPIEPIDKDDAKAKRKKDKVKKKKWVDDEDFSSDSKTGQKKRKSVVEGKDLYEQGFTGKKSRRKDGKNKQRVKVQQKTQITVPKAIKRRIKIDETIDLSELAKRMSIKANEMIQKLMSMGVMVTVNQTIDFDTAALVAAEFDYEVEKTAVAEDILLHINEADSPDKLITRSPVVTIMGHVDHGKTSLLDVIRKSKIVTGEAGGITQHIGAYSVKTPNGGVVTFLDTPGHAAFTSMRSRGAKITDIVVLVVAADDGVMPQTIEAINHSKAAGVPVVVAVNKIDKPNAEPDKVMRELAEQGLLAEEWGGDVIFAKVSAKAAKGIDELLEMILLQAEVLELKANPDKLASGHVIEARLDAGRGPVATVLVQQGTLKTGQPVVCGLHSGKIRLMSDDMGKSMDAAGPSTPVEIVGLSGVPEAGDEFVALASEKNAKHISESRMQKERAKELAKKSRANLEKLFANMGSTDQAKQLKLIIKADVHGSLEALNESLIKLSQEEVDIKIVHSGTGAINESDVSLAAVSDAIIIGFNVRPTPKVREMAKDENVDMRFYDIIYNVINDIKTALTGLMPSTFHEIIIGRAEVRDTFTIPNKGTIAGCFVQDGKVARGEKIRLLRDGIIKCDSSLSSLRRFKDDAKEVLQGYECGIGIEKYNDIKVGDIIECYQVEERKASIDSIKE